MRGQLKLLLFFFLFVLGGCHTSSLPPSQLTVFSQTIMTINYRILVGASLTHQQKQVVQQIIHSTFTEIDAIYNKWNPYSELSYLNALKAYEMHILSPQLYDFFKKVDKLVYLSEGRFDPTVEPLENLWKTRLEKGVEPSESELKELKPCIGWDKIHFNEGIFFKEDDRTQLDLGGIAKGFCVDLIIRKLNSAGFPHLYVEWGGEIRTSGHHPDQRPWNVYISRLADSNPAHAIAYLSLTNQAIATSGDYFQYWTVKNVQGENKTYCHIFNPKTLSPLIIQPGSIASASLVADDCMTADGLAKVLMLFPSVEEAQKWINTLQEIKPELTYWILTR
jgi:FAD:protein FMN transferase